MSGGRIKKAKLGNRYSRLREIVYNFLVKEILNFTSKKTQEELYKAIKSGDNIHADGYKILIPEF